MMVFKEIGHLEYLVEGSLNLEDFNDRLDTSLFSEDYESLGGYIIEHLDRMPFWRYSYQRRQH